MLAADTMQLGDSNYPRWLDSESSKFYWATRGGCSGLRTAAPRNAAISSI